MTAVQKPSPFRVISRAEWGAAAPARPMESQAPPREAFLHYSDSSDAARIDTQAEAFAAVRGIQAFHTKTRGWSDLAYHYVVVQLQAGGGSRSAEPQSLVLAGRSSRMVPAAQQGHNTGTLAICVYAGPLDTITRRTRFVVEEVLRRHPQVRTLGGHRDVVATSCPGEHLYAQIPQIARAAGVSVYRAPSK